VIEEKWCNVQTNLPTSSGRPNVSDPPRELYLGLLYATEQHKVVDPLSDIDTGKVPPVFGVGGPGVGGGGEGRGVSRIVQ
jgi:hypothetical protein